MGELDRVVARHRAELKLTQDKYGAKYGVSGPAVFKFEKGDVRPSLELWMRIAADAGIPERRAVLMWVRERLPPQYRRFVEPAARHKPADGVDYAAFDTHEEARAALREDPKAPPEMRVALDDDHVWTHFRPLGHELNVLRDRIAPLGKGRPESYLEALRLVRAFTSAA